MALQTSPTGLLYYGDNLEVLRQRVEDESVDLIYLDPPFNSRQDYNVLFSESPGVKSHAQIRAFSDTWTWDEVAEKTYQDLIFSAPIPVVKAVAALREFVGERSDVMAYLVMMAVRLQELHRVLKPTGSLYLHCDPTASHYLKVVLDTIFDPRNFRNEIIWQRSHAHSDAAQGRAALGRVHDTLLFYTKGAKWTWNSQYTPYSEAYIARRFVHDDGGRRYKDADLTAARPGGDTRYEWRIKRFPGEAWASDLDDEWKQPKPGWEYRGVHASRGRYWAYSKDNMRRFAEEGKLHYFSSGTPRLRQYADEMPGVSLQDVWTDIPPINSQAQERLGYPTQKPVALLERIVRTSSNEGDVVLDPFCGCGTTIEAAEKLGRRWMGIDITSLAIALIEYRLNDAFPSPSYETDGIPKELVGAQKLALRDRHEFQNWALGLVRAKPLGGAPKKGADQGVDGVVHWIDSADEKLKTAVVSVKSGHVNSGMVRDLRGTMEAQGAHAGLFVTLERATAPMRLEAVKAGFYHSEGWGQDYPALQVLQVEDLLNGQTANLPPTRLTFKKAPEAEKPEAEQIVIDMLAAAKEPSSSPASSPTPSSGQASQARLKPGTG